MVFILLGDGFEESEALVPADLLRRAGVEVKLVGLEGYEITGSHSITVKADLTLNQVDAEQMEMLFLPGGLGGVASIMGNPSALALIQKAYDQGCWLCAICAAPTILAHLGLLDRRKAVCYPGMEARMGSAIVQCGVPVVTDGRLITGEAAGSSLPFALRLIEALKGHDAAQKVEYAIHYHG